MKRLLKNSIYFAIIAVILVAAARTYEGSPIIGGDEVVWGDFPVTTPVQWRKGTSPQEQINYLADLMHVRYPNNITITGMWGTRPLTGTDYIRYEISVNYEGSKNPGELADLKDLESKVIGELAIATARMRTIETEIPGIETNVLNEMAIFVAKAYVARRSLEGEANAIFESVPRLGDAMDKKVYVFGRGGIVGLSKETNPLNWEIYQKPLVYDNMIPNAGIKDIQPPPDAKPSKKPASSPDEVFQVEGDKKDKK